MSLYGDNQVVYGAYVPVFAFHTPDALLDAIHEPQPLRERLKTDMPPLQKGDLRGCQFEAITNLEESFAESRPRALIQMATGSGKTYAAVSAIYRLLRFARTKRKAHGRNVRS